MAYQIEFLDHDAFDALPYPDMDRSLGVADPKTQRAFVRKTGIKAVDLFNAAHELEHLQDGHDGAHADHYRNGVYYKDFGQFLQASIPGTKEFSRMFPTMVDVAGPAFGLPPGMGTLGKSLLDPQQPQTDNSSVMGQFQNASQGATPQVSTPNVVQAGGSGSGNSSSGGGPSGGGGLTGIQDQLYGNYAGRG